MTKPPNFKHTKYLFAGAGASAILLLLCMEQDGLLEEGNMVLVEPASKKINDKTFCFWDSPNSLPLSICNRIISKSWEKIRVDNHAPELLKGEKYYHISSIDLYAELYRLIREYNLQLVPEFVEQIEIAENKQLVKTESGMWMADMVFDSRPPVYHNAERKDVHLIQSFVGWVIEIDQKLADKDCVDLMDFNVEQLNFTQFVYVLPFTENKLLVELTRFGNQVLTKEEADPLIHDYIKKRWGNYSIVDIETGQIPMSSGSIMKEDRIGLVSLGGRAGAVKPSTGYAFKNMLAHAKSISNSLKNNQPIIEIKKKSRFVMYDRLLLDILDRTPEKGKRIFCTLFNKNKTTDVLSFLDEKTHLFQEIKIFASLPVKPFLFAFFKDLCYRQQRMAAPLFLLLVTIVLLFLQSINPAIYTITEAVLLVGGLVILGIPHGAIDHLLENNQLEHKPDFKFIVKYIGVGVGCYVLWLYFPAISLVSFLLYSIWHFGQADWKEWNSAFANKWNYFFWGMLLFGIILYGHANETNEILALMGGWKLKLTEVAGLNISIVFVITGLVWGMIKKCIPLVLSCIMLWLGTGLPLITSFGLYFIGQHSLNSWSHIKKQLNVNNWALFKKSLLFNIGAIVIFIFWVSSMKWKDNTSFMNHDTISAFFIFLSCISLPHVLVMNKFYQKFINA